MSAPNPFDGPRTTRPRSPEDVDPSAPRLAQVAGWSTALAGAILTAAGVQALVVFVFPPGIAYDLVPWLQIGAGLPAMPIGATLARGRPWAIWATVALMAPSAAAGTAWALNLLLMGALSPLAWLGPIVSLLALLLAVTSIPAVRDADAARRHLMEDP